MNREQFILKAQEQERKSRPVQNFDHLRISIMMFSSIVHLYHPQRSTKLVLSKVTSKGISFGCRNHTGEATTYHTLTKLRRTRIHTMTTEAFSVDALAQQMDYQLDIKPPLLTTNSAPPVLQSDYVIHEGFTFGSCPSPASQSDFIGTPAAEKGAFEYPESHSASSSRRPSLAHPSLRRGSSTSSTTSTVTALSTSTRRPSLAPAYAGPSDYDNARRRGSLAHFPTRPVHAPIPPSILARRGSLPAADSLFGLPNNERRSHSRSSLSSSSPILTPKNQLDPTPTPHSPPPRLSSFRLRMPPTAFARRGSLPASPSLTESVAEQGEPAENPPPRSRQASSTSSARGSNLSRSSFSSEDAIGDDESTDETCVVDTPGSASETETTGLFTDPWKGGVDAAKNPIVERRGEGQRAAMTV